VPDPARPLILITNDDGIGAAGLHALEASLAEVGEVWTVAPETAQSAKSHSITLHKPLRLRSVGDRRWAASGTPTDCVMLAVNHLLPRRPALVASGINHGANLGNDVTYSGTVAGALEAAIMGLPGLAFSHLDHDAPDFRDGAAFAARLAREVIERGLPDGVHLNVNFPATAHGEVRGVRVADLGRRSYGNNIVVRADPRGTPYYWIGGDGFQPEDIPGSDCNAVVEKCISVTALTARPQAQGGADLLRGWGIESP
jgi:5'-nucleotidase